MLFTSVSFLLFFALLLVLYYTLPRALQQPLLFAGNLVFYGAAGWQGLVFLAVSSGSVWLCARQIGSSFAAAEAFKATEAYKTLPREERKTLNRQRERNRKSWLLAALILNLGILGVLKYTGFVLSCFGVRLSVSLFVPLGISFYTFRAVSYLLDVYREKTEAEQSLAWVLLYLSFFPLMIQGPITHYGDLREALSRPREWNFRTVSFGLQRMVWGYFKKLVIADRLLPAVSIICGDAEQYSGSFALLGALLYAVQLYADFTGGIDITIGAAETLGIPVAENFLRPFFSESIAEYWRRWHISMGAWFKDYVFYPLSVSKGLLKLTKALKQKSPGLGKRFPVYTATLVTWFLTGLWHGAAWSFIVWGLLNAVLILLGEELKPLSAAFARRFPRLNASFALRLLRILRTFALMCALRMLDCYGSVRVAFRAFCSIFTARSAASFRSLGLTAADAGIVGIGIALMLGVSLLQERQGSVRALLWKREWTAHALFTLLAISVVLLGAYGIGYDSAQFIYNRF